MRNNLDEFYDFEKHLKTKEQYPNGDVSFLGFITYTIKGIDFTEKLNVNLLKAGIDYGKIRMDEGSTINSNNFHLDFILIFKNMCLTKVDLLI